VGDFLSLLRGPDCVDGGGSAGTESTAAIAGAFTAERQRLLLTQTLLVATGAAAAASSAGLPLGIALARCDPRRVQFARFAFTIPLLLPSYVLALAWVALAETQLVEWTYGMPAAILVLAFRLSIVMLATESAMRSVPSHLEEAGWLVDSHPRVWLNIVIPLIVPSLTASAVLVFVLALSDFAVPSLLRVPSIRPKCSPRSPLCPTSVSLPRPRCRSRSSEVLRLLSHWSWSGSPLWAGRSTDPQGHAGGFENSRLPLPFLGLRPSASSLCPSVQSRVKHGPAERC
jgi:hypothetical protein